MGLGVAHGVAVPIDNLIASLAESQYGRVSRHQLVGAGATPSQIDRRVNVGHLVPTLPSVYRIAGAPVSWEACLTEMTLFGGPGSAASHRAAAVLHDLVRGPGTLEVSVSRKRRPTSSPPEATFHTSLVLPRADITKVRGVACTTVERTLIDLGAVTSEQTVASALDAALRTGKTDLALLTYLHAHRRGRGRRGAGVLARILDRVEYGITESPYERRLADELIDLDLPLPRFQHEIRSHGRLIGRADFAWPEEQLVVEVDGHEFHSSREQRARDAARQNELVKLGWTILRYTSDQIATDLARICREISVHVRSCRD